VEVTEGDGCDASGPVMMVHKTKRLRVRCPVQKEAPLAVAACCVFGEEGSYCVEIVGGEGENLEPLRTGSKKFGGGRGQRGWGDR
jgi:hypothetical protein